VSLSLSKDHSNYETFSLLPVQVFFMNVMFDVFFPDLTGMALGSLEAEVQ
jgi:hypothetical protein